MHLYVDEVLCGAGLWPEVQSRSTMKGKGLQGGGALLLGAASREQSGQVATSG